MWLLIGLAVVIGILALGLSIFAPEALNMGDARPKYNYNRRNFFMTKAEHEFYDSLGQAVGHEYRIFAQVHLPTLVDEKVKGQDWRAARAHINRKSVDFVLCDKEYLSPKLAIELDDSSHERSDRQERDKEVERILARAGVPLLRIGNDQNYNAESLTQKVAELALK